MAFTKWMRGSKPLGKCWIGPARGAASPTVYDWTARLWGALVLSLLSWTAEADHLQVYNYTVLRNGDAIGTHRVTVLPEGRDVKVEATTDLAVTFGPVTLYRLEHLRNELWRDGELETLTAYTDKNGDIFDIAITRDPEGYTRVINGRTDRFDPTTRLLALWHDDLFKFSSFISPMEDRTYRISVDPLGPGKTDLFDRTVDGVAYRISGDTNRELWYDTEGHVMKVRLLDHGSAIEYVLNSITSAVPKLAAGVATSVQPRKPIARAAARR